ncbi:TetR/AcrR family transcriptional regulator C-terminal domain-containing protein [Sphingopyxis flava]|uniref:Transcriptional regulator, TetR family n=1 Tax=Sphingopyxis flava TaxID=1507287 RepID=A0A1T5B4A1_9SPHN|nr:TetR/AcrR family transcriptional regulator C-terminal domain-containing protein [Sphingopyxis flava]SKB42121.1 transcriptional regulator, TetR family [Sphingopyxis flava]
MIPASTVSGDGAAAARRKAFVDAAREAFFANGYAGTTMSSIAGKVGGSKTTLWTYFPSKEALFEAVVDDIVQYYGAALQVDLPVDEEVLPVLRRFCRVLVTTLTSDPLLALYQLVIGEARRFPHLAQTFYDRGPRRGKARLAVWITAKMDRGELRRGDPLQAVYHLAGLCQAGLFQFTLLNLAEARRIGRDRIEAEIDAALDTFYRAWGPES